MEIPNRPPESIDDAARQARRLVEQLTNELAAIDRAVSPERHDLRTGRALLADAAAAARRLADALAASETDPAPTQTVESE